MWVGTDVGGSRESWVIHTPGKTAGVTVHMYTEHRVHMPAGTCREIWTRGR